MARAARRLRGNADREGSCRNVADDVRVRRDDRLSPDARAGVEHRPETDLRAILEHNRCEAILEALEHGVPDVVRDDDRAHRQEHLAADEHRPADVDERLVADERQIADRERRPRVAVAASAKSNRTAAPDACAQERAPAAELQIGTELRELADRDDLLADDRRPWPEPNTVLDDDSWRDDERPLAEVDTVADPGTGVPKRAHLVGRRERPERLVVEIREKCQVERTGGLIELERRRQRDALRRDTREGGTAGRASPTPCAGRSAPRRPSR